MDVIENTILNLLERHKIEIKIRNGQAIARYCPFCHGGDHKDVDTFAVSLHNGSFNCMRGNCGKKGSYKDLCNFFGETYNEVVTTNYYGKKKQYDKPNIELKPLTKEIIDYFAKRKISKATLDAYGISSDDKGNIVFPLYRNKELIGAKFRRPYKFDKDRDKKKEWATPNMEPILFGMDNVSFNKPLFITEGQIDAMSLYEAGITNAVSIPMGASNLDFIELSWDWLENFNQIVLFGDNDSAGITCMTTLSKRLGEERCLIAPSYPELIVNGVSANKQCKDANEILFAYGPEFLKELADSCEPVPIKGILNLADVQYVDPEQVPRIYTRIPEVDGAIGGLAEGSVTVFTGKRGEGKSTINGQLLLNGIAQDYKVCAYSGELPAQQFLNWIFLQATESKYIGVKHDQRNGKKYPVVSSQIQKRIREWIDGRFFLFDNAYIDDVAQQEAILKVFTVCAKRYGCKLFLVDNLMIALTSSDEENKAQARFAAALKAFAVKYKAAVILVAHPRKTKQGEAITNDDVSGSSAITNLADNVISVEKPNLRITKNRDFGVCKFIECGYDPANRRIFQANVGDRIMYGWNHEGIELPEDPASNYDEFSIQFGSPSNAPI